MRIPLFFHPDMIRHSGGPGHPERPERLQAIREHLLSAPYAEHLQWPECTPVDRSKVDAVHDRRYIDRLERASASPVTFFDTDTSANEWSYRAALLAAGASVAAVDLVCDESTGSPPRPFALVRPPGHHAEPDRAMGFCFINSAAVAAQHAIVRHGLQRVAIVDWDVHHGNGTQRIFWDRADVFYASLHEHPLYPGTGSANECGGRQAHGATLNIPLQSGSGEDAYLRAFDEQLLPALEQFRPQLIIVSAGFDAHRADPLATMQLSESSYFRMTRRLLALAAQHTGGRIVHLLEGGYDLGALTGGVDSVIRALLDQQEQETE